MRYATLDELTEKGEAGDFYLVGTGDNTRMFLRCPADVPEGESLPIVELKLTLLPGVPGFYTWDGNKEAPTLRSDIKIEGVWHGSMEKGRLSPCSDC